MAQLRAGSTVGGYVIVDKAMCPFKFRVVSGKIQYSSDGIVWKNI